MRKHQQIFKRLLLCRVAELSDVPAAQRVAELVRGFGLGQCFDMGAVLKVAVVRFGVRILTVDADPSCSITTTDAALPSSARQRSISTGFSASRSQPVMIGEPCSGECPILTLKSTWSMIAFTPATSCEV